MCLRVLSSEQAAAVLTQGLTAHYLAYDTYAIQRGDTVLVHAGAGGVGLLLTQMAKRLGRHGDYDGFDGREGGAFARGRGGPRDSLYAAELSRRGAEVYRRRGAAGGV